MFTPVPVAIGLRYLRAKRRNGFISFISLASILGIGLGVVVLITTLSVMGGFQKEIRDRLLQMSAHATVTAYGAPMNNWETAMNFALQDVRVAGAAPFIEKEALLGGNTSQPAKVQGIIPSQESTVSVLTKKMVQGSADTLVEGSYNILLGKELALWLGVKLGDDITVTLNDFQGGPMGAMPRVKRFHITGIFEAGYNEIDRHLAFVHLNDIQRILRMEGRVTGIRLKLHNMDLAWDTAQDLATRFQPLSENVLTASDWSTENANLYQSLKMEKTVMGILLSLIIAMGAFNLVSSQVMLVTDKQADIAILRTLGISPRNIMFIFMVQGGLIGVIGTVMGVIGGIILTLNLERILKVIESIFNVSLLPGDIYYITGLPTQLQAHEVIVIAIIAMIMSLLATLYPAWSASRILPAEALRYE